MKKLKSDFTQYHVKIAAEAIAAAQFSRVGYNISVQYGADQPEYDLMISKGDNILKVSVKGSKDGSWGLTQDYLKDAKYHEAINEWLSRHGSKTIMCFVQFKDKNINEMPVLYIATPGEVAKRLKETSNGRGNTELYINHTWTRKNAAGYGTTERIPIEWDFSKERVEQLFKLLCK